MLRAAKRSRLEVMRFIAMVPWIWLVSCAPARPPLAVRNCMQSIVVTTGIQPVPADLLMQSSAACYYREDCLDTLRKRACELDGYQVVISNGPDAPYALQAAPGAAAIRQGRIGSRYVIHAWIARKPSGNHDR